jgi:hypothetical protein
MTSKNNELMGMYTKAIAKKMAKETEKYRKKKKKKRKATLLQTPGEYSDNTYNISLFYFQGSQSGSDSDDSINFNDKSVIPFLSFRDNSF